MWKFILYALLIWFLYNLIFRFIIPVYKASRQMKQKFSEIQQRMQEQMKQQEQAAESSRPSPAGKASSASAGDYIDFEEIK
ncbi:MAG TPA: hypothetical protein PKC69_01905 [Chitinophagaceae bacterium]|nr:hypothetical protein [Chitinophagaceae bacterium]